jgi:DNA-binding NtrC family response regulator
MHAQAIAFDPEPMPRAQPSPARILVLEADPDTRSWLVAELGLAGYDVLHAASASDAFVASVGSHEPVDLLVMNPVTARGEGLFLWSRLSFLQPNMPVVLPIISPEVNRDPTAVSELVSEVRDALGSAVRSSGRAT